MTGKGKCVGPGTHWEPAAQRCILRHMSEPTPIGLTLGDPAGIGPEVATAALSVMPLDIPIRTYGPRPMVEELASRFARVIPIATTNTLDGVMIGRYNKASGVASVNALEAAFDDLARGIVGALVTGPVCKTALQDANLPFPGQTEWVASALGVSRFAMMLAGPRLRVALVTTHLALRDVADRLSRESIASTVALTADFLQRFEALLNPRIGVLALNPHASDQGRFGHEEATLIAPVIADLQGSGLTIEGPLPADTAFHRAAGGDFDALVAMYHDQGLGPLKLLHFSDAINITLGLPRIRCSPDHGPAFDLAGTNRADPTSMLTALRFAIRAVRRP